MTFLDRFWAKIDDSAGVDACWPWLGYLLPSGYSQLSITNAAGRVVTIRPPRLALELTTGVAVTDGLTIDHTCHDAYVCNLGVRCPHRACVNPAHLEAVTNVENIGRSASRRYERLMEERFGPRSNPAQRGLIIFPIEASKVAS